MKDRTNTLCKKCKKGKYIETSVMDDMFGDLHCSNCKHRVDRHEKSKDR